MFTMLILRRRFEAAILDMVNALFRSGRSGVLNTAMDFSCCITDSKLQTISSALGLPMHVTSIDLIPRAVIEKFGTDIRPGDCFVNNSGYHGNTHCADFTLCAPVFVNSELVFYSVARAHLGDIGFPTPTTYSPLSRDLYEEGLILPCVRIQREGRDVAEVVDICRANIRAPDQFYGDYLAVLAAVRTGDRNIQAICRQYGLQTVQAFLDQYQRYAEDMASAAIRRLPAGRVSREARHDSDTPLYPEGIPVRATLAVDPEAARVTVDLRDNVDNLPLGINMTEATVLASCRNAVLGVLGPDVPRCSGAFRRIEVLMRHGSAIGRPRFPAATSAATTNLAQVLNPLIASMFDTLDPTLGSGFPTVGNPATCACVSGSDSRRAGRAFANQIIIGYWGGAALYGHDGWLTFGGSGAQGVLWQSSVEVVEQQQPLLVECLEIAVDSGGAGQWEGAPGAHLVYRVRDDSIRFTSNAAGRDFPPRGALGGLAGGPSLAWKIDCDGRRTLLRNSFDVTLARGEALDAVACGGGGYGDPLDRDPAAVAERLREGWISPVRARDVYGVVIDERCSVNATATVLRRRELRAARAGK
jgi:N-methylhydantoinase B